MKWATFKATKKLLKGSQLFIYSPNFINAWSSSVMLEPNSKCNVLSDKGFQPITYPSTNI